MKLKLVKFSINQFVKRNLIRKDLRIGELYKIIPWLLRGFDTDNIRLYNLNRGNSNYYLHDSIRHKITLNSNINCWPILHDKLFFHSCLKEKLPFPECYCVVNGKKLISVDYDIDKDLFFEYLNKNDLILKPLQGGKGKGIHFIKQRNGTYLLGENEISKSNLYDFVIGLNYYGIFRVIKQHQILSNIYNKTTNTIRLNTFLIKNEVVIVAVLRIGNNSSKPFDNFSQGGMVSLINNHTGEISSACIKGKNGFTEVLEQHPDSKTQIAGLKIPFWSEIVRDMKNFILENPFFDYVGWDILAGEEKYYIIEGNHNPDLDLIQIHQPLLKNELINDYFKERNII